MGAILFDEWRQEKRFSALLELHKQGRYQEAAEGFKALAQDARRSSSDRAAASAYNVACAYARMGRGAEALEWLGKAEILGYRDINNIRDDPDLASIRGEPG